MSDNQRHEVFPQCCGNCEYWKQVSNLNVPPIGKCTWEPLNDTPFWYQASDKSRMLFQSDGIGCKSFEDSWFENSKRITQDDLSNLQKRYA
jgi:hypothetical protein